MIGIITAMNLEAEGIKDRLTGRESQKISGFEFTQGRLNGTDVVVCVCGIGKVFAGTCAEIMALRYSPDYIINTGVGGTLTDKLTIGDVAVGVEAVQHDMDTTPIGDPRGFLSIINEIYLKCDERLVKLICRACNAEKIHYETGTIATGDVFVSSDALRNEIRENFRDCISCEMEGAAIGQICTINKIPFAIIRAISDSADGDSPDDFGEFAGKAAERSIRVLERVVGQLD